MTLGAVAWQHPTAGSRQLAAVAIGSTVEGCWLPLLQAHTRRQMMW